MEGGVSVVRSRRHAAGTVPAQPRQRRAPAARRVGFGVLCGGLALLGAIACYRLVERPRATKVKTGGGPDNVTAARLLSGAAAVLSFSVLADSGLEHYRGAYHNPAMYLAPTVSAAALANSLHMTLTPAHYRAARTALAGVALATGLGGLAFHLYNVGKREGGFGLQNLFYAAPLGAPIAITLAGLAGLAASQLVLENEYEEPATLLGVPAGQLLAAGSSVGLIGTIAEVALLHFRGAFHNPFMFVPMTLPPVTAIALALTIWKPGLRDLAKWLLRATALMGGAGAGFHIYGVQRNMGGFHNWSQNLLNGPPIPAPPSFTGVALAGLSAIKLMGTR